MIEHVKPTTFSTTTATITITAHDIIWVQAQPDVMETPEHAHENLHIITSLLAERQRPLGLDLTGARFMSRDVRHVYQMHSTTVHPRAIGIVVTSAVGRVYGNFVLTRSRNQLQTRLFATPETALAWLQRFAAPPTLNAVSASIALN